MKNSTSRCGGSLVRLSGNTSINTQTIGGEVSVVSFIFDIDKFMSRLQRVFSMEPIRL